MKMKIFLQVLCIILICAAVFSAVAFFLTRQELLGVDVPKTDVPYIDGKYVPADSTVLVIFENGGGAAIEILFGKQFINAVLLSDATVEEAEKYGFHITHTVSCDYTFLMKFIDTLGGIDSFENPDYILTGVQVCNLLATEVSGDIPKLIMSGIFDKISKIGFSTDALSCIIENTHTTLSAPACYGWSENLSECCVSYNIIDGRIEP